MSPSKKTRELTATLTRTRRLLEDVAKEVETIESLAFESHVGERKLRRGKRPDGGYLIDTGDRRYKRALDDMEAKATGLAASVTEVLRLLRAGPAPDKMKGTLLGDPETGAGAQKELSTLVRKARERAERGEYTPHRVEPQPKVPGER